MIIVCDVDNCLNDLMKVALDMCNEELYNAGYNTSYALNDITAYNMDNCLPPEVAQIIKSIFNGSSVWDFVKPISGAQNSLEKLINKGHQIYLATDNCPNTYGDKVAWIQRFFPFIDASKIICIKDKWMLRADVMIEDCLQALLAKPYYHRIVMDYPWNRSVHDYAYDIHRCSNWDEIVDAIDKINERE